MSGMSKKKKTNIILTAFVIVMLLAVLVSWASFKPRALEGVKTITVIIGHSNGTVRTEEIETNAQYLDEALEPYELLQGTETDDGFFVWSVDGEYANAEAEVYWTFEVNGEETSHTVDTQPISDGSIYYFHIIY